MKAQKTGHQQIAAPDAVESEWCVSQMPRREPPCARSPVYLGQECHTRRCLQYRFVDYLSKYSSRKTDMWLNPDIGAGNSLYSNANK